MVNGTINNLKECKTLVIIPSYNNANLLKKCLLHLKNQDTDDFSTIIVDNGSDNQTVEFIKEFCKDNTDYIAVFLDNNTGFAYASNVGFKYSIENGYKYSLLLNNDCYVESNLVNELTKAIGFDDSKFAINPLMISYKNTQLVDDFGDSYNIFGFAFQNKVGHKVSAITKDENVFSACGGASIYRNEILKKIGFLDENFFCYLEDIDLSYRAHIYGYKVGTCLKAKCYHVGSATSGSKYNDFKVYISARNNIYLIYKNMPILQIIINFLPLLIGIIIKQMVFIKKGFGKSYFKGLSEAFQNIKKIDKIHPVMANLYEVTKGDSISNSILMIGFSSFLNYVKIEFYLITNTFRYIKELFGRYR